MEVSTVRAIEGSAASRVVEAMSDSGLKLFLTGFLVLFLELACIRWFAANVIFLHFFTNVVLLAAFLGMSCGCMAARSKIEWLNYFPTTTLLTIAAAMVLLAVYERWQGLAVDVGHQASPQQVYFGTEYRNPDVARFSIPIDLIVAVFFVLIALMFVGLGQVLGRAFDGYPDRVKAYTLNIGGSLVGIVAFSLLSLVEAGPLVWFGVVAAGVGFLLYRTRALTVPRAIMLVALLLVALPSTFAHWRYGVETTWSPYYAVQYNPKHYNIDVDNVGHQQMVPYDKGGSAYALIHLLQRAAGGAPFDRELIIGAGSGNDVERALHYGVERVDAVEIDPAIQRIGIKKNPDHPYQDPRVIRHIDDGRHFLRTTSDKYDLVVYALVDSLILHSSYANLRLESYLFTREALEDVKHVLKPGGVFVTYNYFRQGWVVERVAAMAQDVFGCKPVVISLPYKASLRASEPTTFSLIVASCNSKLVAAIRSHPAFWLNEQPAQNANTDGFTFDPSKFAPTDRAQWQKIAPSEIVHDAGAVKFASDDWPFLYIRDRFIPDLNVRSMLVLGTLGLLMVYLFLPKGGRAGGIDWRMFFLGAAFMLLETKAVVQLALLFGSTWLVNSLVFFTALVLVLLANLTVLRMRGLSLIWPYGGLLILLAATIAVPVDVFLSGGIVWRYAVPAALALGPMYFAGVVFALTFRDSENPDMAFGSNIAGSVVGGLCESFSMLLGFRYLILLAVAFYLFSGVKWRRASAA